MDAIIKGRLGQPLDKGKISYLPGSAGPKAGKPYLAPYVAIEQANIIFAFEWSSELVERPTLVFEAEADGKWIASYRAVVRVSAVGVVHEGTGLVTSQAQKVRGDAHDIACKGAETDALKRALAKFGPQFGSALGDPDDPLGQIPATEIAAQNGHAPAAVPSPSHPEPRPMQTAGPAPSAALEPGVDPASMGQAAPAPAPAPEAPKGARTPLAPAVLAQALKSHKQRFGALPPTCERLGIRSPSQLAAAPAEALLAIEDEIQAAADAANGKAA